MHQGEIGRSTALLTCLVLMLTGCGGDDAPPQDPQQTPGHSHAGHTHDVGTPVTNFAFTLGEPGEDADSSQMLAVNAQAGFRFSPSAFEVKVGETVTFQITNRDVVDHEFVLGNKEYQELHNNQAKSGGVYHDYSAYSEHVNPGDSLRLVWRFDTPGRVLFACHVGDHYDRGMIGEIRIR